jgi:hypothetical protein
MKKVKQWKENAENACHKILLTQPSPLSASPRNTSNHQTETEPKSKYNAVPAITTLSTGPAIKDSPGIWSVLSNDTVIYGTLLPPVLIECLLNPKCNWYCALPVEDPEQLLDP